MITTATLNKNLLYFGTPVLLFAILISLTQSPLIENKTFGMAITVDLLLTVPLAYLLVIYKSKIPKNTVVPMMVVGLVIGTYFLPEAQQFHLALFEKWALPVIELSVLAVVVFKVRKAIKTYKRMKGTSPDFFHTLKDACHEVLPKILVMPFATEVAVFYYGFINWKSRKLEANEFTYHKKSGTPALLGALIFIIMIETFSLHLLIGLWNGYVAWALSALSIYTAIQFVGIAKSLSQRPIYLGENHLFLRYGMVGEAKIPYDQIKSIHLSRKRLEKDPLNQSLSPFGELESQNVVIALKQVNTMQGFYGISKKVKNLGLHIDEPEAFKAQLEAAMQKAE